MINRSITRYLSSSAVFAAATGAAEKAEKTDRNIRVAGVNPMAIKLGQKLKDSVFDELDAAVEADNFLKVVALNLADYIKKSLTKAEIASMPIADTNKTEDENYKGNNPDYTKVQDGKKTRRVSYFDTMIEAHPKGKALIAAVEKITDDIAAKKAGDQFVRQAELIKAKKRLTSWKGKFRTGIKIVQQEMAMTDFIGDAIKVEYWKDKAGKIIESPSPIYLYVVSAAGNFENFSVSQFLSLDPESASIDRTDDTPLATWEALLATLNRGVGDDEDDDSNVVINDSTTFMSACAAMLHYMSNTDNMAVVYRHIDKAKDFNDIAHIVRTFGNLTVEWNAVKEHFAKKIQKAELLLSEQEGTLDAKSRREAIANG